MHHMDHMELQFIVRGKCLYEAAVAASFQRTQRTLGGAPVLKSRFIYTDLIKNLKKLKMAFFSLRFVIKSAPSDEKQTKTLEVCFQCTGGSEAGLLAWLNQSVTTLDTALLLGGWGGGQPRQICCCVAVVLQQHCSVSKLEERWSLRDEMMPFSH